MTKRVVRSTRVPQPSHCGHRAGRYLDWTFVNRRHVGDLAASIRPSRPRAARLVRLTQCTQQLTAQSSAWQHIAPRIDRLGRTMLAHVVRIRVSESPGNLLRRVALPQLGLDMLPQPGIHEFARAPRLTGPSSRQCLRRAGQIGAVSRGVASQLAADGAGGSSQHPVKTEVGCPQNTDLRCPLFTDEIVQSVRSDGHIRRVLPGVGDRRARPSSSPGAGNSRP